MALSGTIVKQVNIKSDGDMFLETYRYRPHHISQMSPGMVKGVDLHEGEWGTVGSVIVWNMFIVAKEVIEAIDEEKKLVRFKVTEGYIMDVYKTFAITIRLDTHGEESVLTWTFDYVKVNENMQDPDRLVELVLSVAKDIETHHLLHLQPN
ncbi:putative Bet v I/Major latex protein [Helianthus debilis subsp. tardiflorus]